MGAAEEVQRVGREADRSRWVEVTARVGFVAYGVVHLLVAWVAVDLVVGRNAGHASPDGALARLARQPFGHVLVWAVAAGMFLLVGWRLLELVAGPRGASEDAARLRARLGSLGAGIVYAAMGVLAVGIAARQKGAGVPRTSPGRSRRGSWTGRPARGSSASSAWASWSSGPRSSGAAGPTPSSTS